MDLISHPTQPDHTQVQDDLPALYRPRHARTLQPLRENNLAGGLGNARADGKTLAAVVPIAHPMRPLVQVSIA